MKKETLLSLSLAKHNKERERDRDKRKQVHFLQSLLFLALSSNVKKNGKKYSCET